jgi:predicted nucleotidyltransferase
LAALGLRDRDAIITEEGLIFRVFGYSHPSDAYICDAEYAPAEIFKSVNPKAFRSDGMHVFYKFYEDEGWKFIKTKFPKYMIFHAILGKNVVGVERHSIVKVLRPKEKLRKLLHEEPKDKLLNALQDILEIVTKNSRLAIKNFGVFGSLLHGFHHPKFSDVDLIIYGGENVAKLREALQELYVDEGSFLRNEFESDDSIKGKFWRFRNYSSKEFVWHQQRKMIYALFNDEKSGRLVKAEFEPVKNWTEIKKEHSCGTKIVQKGWVKMVARITADQDALFIPSVYGITPLSALHAAKGADEATRIVSYMEEFRMQAQKGEKVYVEGNLEEVTTPEGSFHQIILTYCPRYYEQVLKVVQA